MPGPTSARRCASPSAGSWTTPDPRNEDVEAADGHLYVLRMLTAVGQSNLLTIDPRKPEFLPMLGSSGHRVGTMFFRWLHADPRELPTCRLVSVVEVPDLR